MAELIVVLVVIVGLYRWRGRWEWSRKSLAGTVGDLGGRAGHLVERGRRSLPGVVGQLVEDLRSLGDDLLGLLSPSARRRIEHRARGLIRAGARRTSVTKPAGSRLAAAGPGAQALERLQRSYLDGSITLERYVQEAERLHGPV